MDLFIGQKKVEPDAEIGGTPEKRNARIASTTSLELVGRPNGAACQKSCACLFALTEFYGLQTLLNWPETFPISHKKKVQRRRKNSAVFRIIIRLGMRSAAERVS